MTANKHQKRAIRERAREAETSYSTARAAMGVKTRHWPPTLETLASLPNASDEVIPTTWSWDQPVQSISLRFSDWSERGVPVPDWAVAYAIVGDLDQHGWVFAEAGRTTTLVFCRKLPSEESTWLSLRRAEREYPRLKWVHMSGLQCDGAWPGAEPPYWAFMMTYGSDGEVIVHPGKGLATLAGLLRDMPGAEDEGKPVS